MSNLESNEELKQTIHENSDSQENLEISNESVKSEEQEHLFNEEVENTSGDSSELKSTAKKYGHKSKEQWVAEGKDPALWKSEEEFVAYGESYKVMKPTLDALKAAIEKRDKELEKVLKYEEKRQEREKEKLREELRREIYLAKQQGNAEDIEKLTRQQVQMELSDEAEKVQKIQEYRNQVDTEFLDRNKHWFNDSYPDLKQKALYYSQEFVKYNPNMDYAELARNVEARMKLDHPELVGNVTKQAPIIPSSISSLNKSTMKSSMENEDKIFNSLDEDTKALYPIWERITKNGVKDSTFKPTKKEFITYLKKRGDI